MRGLKRREAAAICLYWLFAAVMFGVPAFTAPQIVARNTGSIGEAAASLLPTLVMLAIGVITVRENFRRLRFAHTRSHLARNPKAWLEEGPYRESMLADEDLVRLAHKVGRLCEAEAATSPGFRHFVGEYASFLEDFEPGVMRHREEARRLEDTVDRVLEHKQRGKPTQPKETT